MPDLSTPRTIHQSDYGASCKLCKKTSRAGTGTLLYLAGDAKTISWAPGIGTKTAQRLIIELKDKLDLGEAFEIRSSHQAAEAAAGQAKATDQRSDAVQALAALGYSLADATRAVRSVEGAKSMTVEEILKEALKRLAV